MPELLQEQRENWGTRAGFVLAAIGSAVGLGNLWGFPYKLYKYGGGAFLIPYVLGMLLIGIPVLILEFSLGHMTQRAAPDAFRGINRKTEPVGWWGILLGFVIVTYYGVILAYCLHFLIASIQGIFNGGELPWAGTGKAGVDNAKAYLGQYLGSYSADELKTVKPWALGSLVGRVGVSLIAIWALMYLCICKGVKLVSKIVMWTVPLPWLMLFILTVRGLTLEGAASGLQYYLEPDFAELLKPTTWRFAFGQVFFSMSLAFGVMITYASFLHRKSDINNNAMIIGLGDLGTSFIAGLAIFSTLGAMAFATGLDVNTVAPKGGGLAFIAFPYALAQFPHSAWFSTVFFFALITLGIDSAFSITESVLSAILDKTRWRRGYVLTGLSIVGLGVGLVYCSRGGGYWIDTIDALINGPWGIALLGMLECVVLGWGYRIARLRHHANERSDWRIGRWWDWLIRLVIPILLAALFIWDLLAQLTDPEKGFLYDPVSGELKLPTVVAITIALLAPIVAVMLSLVHSPGADEHAEHKGQAPGSHRGGMIGTALALAAFAAVCLAFSFAYRAQLDFHTEPTKTLTDSGKAAIGTARLILTGGLLTGAVAVALGAAGVVGAEAAHRRPSRWARAAASVSVLAIGACIGLLLAIWVMTITPPHKEVAAIEQPSAQQGLEIAAAETAKPVAELSGWSFAVMATMLGLIFGGLLLCFYLALKAAGREAPVQKPEGMEA